MIMRKGLYFIVAVGLSAAGCSGGRSEDHSRRRVADKEVNTRHLKGTTDVLKTYRYGERAVETKKTAEKKAQTPPEKTK